MGSLGDPAIPETGGVGRRPKDMLDTYDLIPILWHTPVQVGHVPHLPQPCMCAVSAIFWQFSTFSARRAPCSAPSCTPDSWTNGPCMTWVLWTLVPMVHTPRGRGGATFVRVLAQSECGQFCHFGICGPHWDCHHAEWHGDLWEPRAWESVLHSWWIAYGMADPISKPAWRYTIGGTPEFWLILSSQKDPLLGPQFHPPVRSIGGPISLCPRGARS